MHPVSAISRCEMFGLITAFRRKKYLEGLIMKWVCNACGYEYDEEKGDIDNGIEPGTKFEDLPEDFLCPWCFVGKEDFSKVD